MWHLKKRKEKEWIVKELVKWISFKRLWVGAVIGKCTHIESIIMITTNVIWVIKTRVRRKHVWNILVFLVEVHQDFFYHNVIEFLDKIQIFTYESVTFHIRSGCFLKQECQLDVVLGIRWPLFVDLCYHANTRTCTPF